MPTHVLSRISGRLLSRLLSQRPPVSETKQIHAQIITQRARFLGLSLVDSLIHCYLNCNNITIARILFDGYPSHSPSTLLWNLIIRGYSKIRDCPESITLFRRMMDAQVAPDMYTFTYVFTSCAHQSDVECGQIVQGLAIKNGSLSNLYVLNSLISVYGAFAMVDEARKVFDEMSEPDVFSFTSLVCAYTKGGNMNEACNIFSKMPLRNDVSWCVMMSGFVGCGMWTEALTYFHRMMNEFKPNEATVVLALTACAHLGSLDQGNRIIGCINKYHVPQTRNITTALIDMYAKCGSINLAYHAFSQFSKRDIYIFTSMIHGLSIHGLGREAILVFRQMLAEDVNPNGITILGVLNGCSHAGLLSQGTFIFYNMERLWGVAPQIEHYSCYIDLLGRAGFFRKALGMLRSMSIPPDVVLWRSLLSACRIHRSSHFGERIANHLQQLDFQPAHGAMVLLSNLYASEAKWEHLGRVRKTICSKSRIAYAGCSQVEVSK